MTQKDRAWGDRFDPEQVEPSITAMASQGWRVVTMTSASLGGDRDGMVGGTAVDPIGRERDSVLSRLAREH